MSKKKLLFVVNVDWFFISHRLPIALKALEQGYEVHILCAITDKAEYMESLGLIVHAFSFTRSGKNIFNELASVVNLYTQVKQIKPDLVHLVTIKPVLYGGIVARLARVPSVVSAISGLGFLFIERKSLTSNLLLKPILFLYRIAMGHHNQKVIFQNPTDMNALVNAGGVSTDKVQMIRGSGVDLRAYPMRPEPTDVPTVIMVSRLLEDKGVLEFVEAASTLNSKGIQACFKLVGEPDFENPKSATEKQLQSWRDDGIVECLGFRSDIAEQFAQANIVVLPSYREGLPKVLIEAAACGRAIVTTDVPGCRDAIEPGVSGILVAARDSQALSEAIERLISDNDLRHRMGQAGRDLAEREFSIEKVVSEHLDIYRELETTK